MSVYERRRFKRVALGHRIGGAMLDVERLLLTPMRIQANSGNGKSWFVRKLFEVTAGPRPAALHLKTG
jgi:hypothetical protein